MGTIQPPILRLADFPWWHSSKSLTVLVFVGSYTEIKEDLMRGQRRRT